MAIMIDKKDMLLIYRIIDRYKEDIPNTVKVDKDAIDMLLNDIETSILE